MPSDRATQQIEARMARRTKALCIRPARRAIDLTRIDYGAAPGDAAGFLGAIAHDARRLLERRLSLLARSLRAGHAARLSPFPALLCALYLGWGLPAAAATASQGAPADPALPDYVPHQRTAGSVLGYTGMDTVEQMMAAWNE